MVADARYDDPNAKRIQFSNGDRDIQRHSCRRQMIFRRSCRFEVFPCPTLTSLAQPWQNGDAVASRQQDRDHIVQRSRTLCSLSGGFDPDAVVAQLVRENLAVA